MVPSRLKILSSRVQVIMKPVAVPTAEAASDGMRRRRPDEVGDSRRTAWK